MKKTVLIQAPVATRSGYGAHSRDLALALIKSDQYEVMIAPTRWGSTPMTALDDSSEDTMLIRSRILGSNTLERKPDIYIQVTIPNEFQPIGEFNIGITAGIETDLAAAEWVEGCNRMDLVIATSKHSAEVLKNSIYDKRDQNGQTLGTVKLEKPIEVLFEGIDQSIYHKIQSKEIKGRVKQALSQIKEDFAFLVVGHWLQGDMGQDRKDIGMTIHTFLQAFKNKKNKPALVLKVSLGGFSEVEIHELRRRIRAIIGMNEEANLPNVYLLSDELTDPEMNELYNHPKIKAMVSLTKGEGFGRPMLEFGTTGKPILASKWSGQLDFLSEEYSWLIPGELTNVHHTAVNDWIIKDSKWFTANYGYAAMLIADTYNNYKTYVDKSSDFRKRIKSEFTLEHMQQLLINIVDKYTTATVQPVALPKLKIL